MKRIIVLFVLMAGSVRGMESLRAPVIRLENVTVENATEVLLKAIARSIKEKTIYLIAGALALGADANAKNREGLPPLLAITSELTDKSEECVRNSVTVIDLLVQYNADVHARHTQPWAKHMTAALLMASDKGRCGPSEAAFPVFKILAEAGADLDDVDAAGKTARQLALEANNLKILDYIDRIKIEAATRAE